MHERNVHVRAEHENTWSVQRAGRPGTGSSPSDRGEGRATWAVLGVKSARARIEGKTKFCTFWKNWTKTDNFFAFLKKCIFPKKFVRELGKSCACLWKTFCTTWKSRLTRPELFVIYVISCYSRNHLKGWETRDRLQPLWPGWKDQFGRNAQMGVCEGVRNTCLCMQMTCCSCKILQDLRPCLTPVFPGFSQVCVELITT